MSEFNDGFDDLIIKAREAGFSADDIDRIRKAYAVAREAHSDQRRRSGEPYIMHPVAVAKILVQMNMDAESICAALLHDVVEDTESSLDDIRRQFGDAIAQLVDGVTKLGEITQNASKEEQQSENVRKMFLAMSKDIRVIIIKLADRLHNMRTLEHMPEEKRRYKARETLEIYAPLAHRLGIRRFKEELEDLAIRFLDPVAYKEIERSLNEQVASQQDFIGKIKKEITDRVTKDVPNAHISARIKSVHGIYRKTYMQGRTMDEIYDIYALRIIVDSIYECYYCLGIIHDMYNPLPGRFKDYISTPKPNMYQSLHTTVIGEDGLPFEVQIRTWEMHQAAEYGIAAHWKYKLGLGSSEKFDERLAWIRQMIENQKESDDVEEIVTAIKTDFVSDEVFAFTPKGQVVSLPVGSTVVDFAYAIHSAVGNKMIGAKVDGRMSTIDHKIKNGEIIEIITSSQPKGPSRDWLKLAATSSARSKIRTWFKRERRDENIAEGKAEIEREFRRNGIRFDDETKNEFLLRIAKRSKLETLEDLYAAIGYGGITISKLLPRAKEEYLRIQKEKNPPKIEELATEKKFTESPEGVIVEGIDNCLIKFAKCCNPLPGDEIIGFITRGHGVSIHTRTCSNVPKIIAEAEEPQRWINAYWNEKQRSSYRVPLHINAMDRVGMLADVTGQLANMHVMIYSIYTQNETDARFDICITVTVTGQEHLKNVIERLKKIKGVIAVRRG